MGRCQARAELRAATSSPPSGWWRRAARAAVTRGDCAGRWTAAGVQVRPAQTTAQINMVINPVIGSGVPALL